MEHVTHATHTVASGNGRFVGANTPSQPAAARVYLPGVLALWTRIVWHLDDLILSLGQTLIFRGKISGFFSEYISKHPQYIREETLQRRSFIFTCMCYPWYIITM